MGIEEEFPYYVSLSTSRNQSRSIGVEEIIVYSNKTIDALQQNFDRNNYVAFHRDNGVYFKYASDAVRFKLMCG